MNNFEPGPVELNQRQTHFFLAVPSYCKLDINRAGFDDFIPPCDVVMLVLNNLHTKNSEKKQFFCLCSIFVGFSMI
jgi:hypothetical protein